MTTRSSHDSSQQHQETSRLCRLLCTNPIDRIPLLELKRVVQAFKQPLPASDTNRQPCSAVLVMIARAEIKRRFRDLDDVMNKGEEDEYEGLHSQQDGLMLCNLLAQVPHRKVA